VAVAPRGLASTWLAQKLPVGAAARMFVNRGRLRLPARGDAPVIMIGASTGIALYRAFLQERRATGASSWSWLLFGGERQADDLYREEMDHFLASGVLTRFDKACPGDATPGVKLCDRILQNGAELWSWLEQGAHVYVSGDAKRMAPEVDAALRSVVAEHGKRSPEEAKAFLTSLAKDKRYLRVIPRPVDDETQLRHESRYSSRRREQPAVAVTGRGRWPAQRRRGSILARYEGGARLR